MMEHYLFYMKALGRVEPEEERHQWVFHCGERAIPDPAYADDYSGGAETETGFRWRWAAGLNRKSKFKVSKSSILASTFRGNLYVPLMIVLMAGFPAGRDAFAGHWLHARPDASGKDEIRHAIFAGGDRILFAAG